MRANIETPETTMAGHKNRSKTNRGKGSNPTASEVKAARDKAGLTQTEAAAKIYSTLRTWQDWEAEDNVRRMHPGLYELFLIKTGQMERF